MNHEQIKWLKAIDKNQKILDKKLMRMAEVLESHDKLPTFCLNELHDLKLNKTV